MIIKTQSIQNNINFIDFINPIKLQHPSRRVQILEHAKAMKLLNSYRKIPLLTTELQSPIIVNSIKKPEDLQTQIVLKSQEKKEIIRQIESPQLKYKDQQNALPLIPLTVNSSTIKINDTNKSVRNHMFNSPNQLQLKRQLLKSQMKSNNQSSNTTAATSNSSKDTSVQHSKQQNSQAVNKNIIYSYCGKQRQRRLNVTARSFIVYDCQENKIITKRKSTRKSEIASLTKIMTFYITLVAIEQFKLDPKEMQIKVTKRASEMAGTSAELKENDVLTLLDLLFGLMLPSGNDAAVLIAQVIGSIFFSILWKRQIDMSFLDIEQLQEDGFYLIQKENEYEQQCPIKLFIKKMNEHSLNIGLKNSQFASVHGMANSENYSCCFDIVSLSIECLKFDLFQRIISSKEYFTSSLLQEYRWKNSNKLLDKGFIGIKTGVTDSAGPCLASAVKENNSLDYIIVVLGCKSLQLRFDETIKLLQHAKQKKQLNTGVGKSCILLQYIDKNFRQSHEATIGVEFGAKQLIIKQKVIKIQIWDTAGQDTFRSITRSYYRGSIGAILVYDITRKETFENASSWVNEIQTYGNDKMVIILVGNKSDLNQNRQVSEEEGKEMAKKFGLEFIEVSAKQNLFIDQAFQRVVDKIYKKIEDNQIDLSNEKCGVKLGSKCSFVNENEETEKKQSSCC